MHEYVNIFQFWKSLDTEVTVSIHPSDYPFIDAAIGINFQLRVGRPPTPWDGPLASAKVIFCYANPKFSEDDLHPKYIDIMHRQLDGNQPLPIDIKHWAEWYQREFGFLGNLKDIQHMVSVFNVCPYASENMSGPNGRVAAGLPSSWAAQKHLREVLIPKALSGEILLVIPRAHQRWGITKGFGCETIVLDAAPHGRIPVEIRPRIMRWLERKC